MAEAVVSVALETLGNLLIQEASFPRGVRDQVEELQVEFRRMQSLLKDADQKQHDSETIRNSIQEIRALAYRAEDVLEEYVVKVGSAKGEGFTNILKRFLCFANEIGTLHNLGSEIKRIKSKITILTRHMNQSGIQPLNTCDQEEASSNENRRHFIRKTYPHEELEHFVGMDDDIEKLVSLLVSDEESRHRVIGVWGMGGSGKTTVAKKVYKHVKVRRFFDSFAWVCITQKCQIQYVIQDIFRQLVPAERKKDTNDIDELVAQIYQVQMEKKCLIIVDDIWKLDDWKCLSKCFPNVGSHSKVLLTTRIGNVAEIGYPIQLKGLTEDEAWKLLRMKAFAKIDFQDQPRDYSEYEKLGRKMIRKCDCLPLAVAVIGGILSGKKSLHEWKLASDDVKSYIGRGEGTHVQGEVEKVLALSYDDLPYHLKPCFLSLGFLREDERAPVEIIYDLWLAECLIQSKHVGSGETMRDVARFYLYELQLRSMVQVDGILALSLHDSILDLCRSKAKEEEFLKVVDNCNISEKAYRLVMHVDGEDNYLDVLKAVENISPLRSVRILGQDFNNFTIRERLSTLILPKEIFNLPQFKSLRILIVNGCDFGGKSFHGIENLLHIRLLGLISCKWERRSLESVDKLSFLQTLDMTGTKSSLLGKDTFCEMRQLRHLYLPTFSREVRIEEKLRLMNLCQLESLNNFESKFYDLKDLIHLQKLRTLLGCVVSDDESLVQITDYICGSNLIRLIGISIKNCSLDGQQESDIALRKLLKIPNVTLQLSIESCRLLKLPRLETEDFSNMCPGLVELRLSNIADIAEDIMQSLDKFPNLRRLWLMSIRFGGEEMICDVGSFPLLEDLYFCEVEGQFELRIDETAMPNLSSMEIRRCSGINFMIPQRLRLFLKIN